MNTEAMEQRKSELVAELNAKRVKQEQLRESLQQCSALINAIEGALQQCDWTIAEMNKNGAGASAAPVDDDKSPAMEFAETIKEKQTKGK